MTAVHQKSDKTPLKIIFLHIHKTAGMSLRGLFVKNYRKTRHFNTGVMEISAAEWAACLERVRLMPAEEMAAHGVFKGHMPFGLHAVIPDRCRYITFLRDPVKRIVSYYRMALRKGQLPEGHRLDPSRADWNLGNFPGLARSFDNGQTRALSVADLELPFGACSALHLQAAKENLDQHFDFVGLTERFDLSLMLLRRLCGWGWHFYVPDNVAPSGSIIVDPEVVKEIESLNQYDVELYRHAASRFEQQAESLGWKLWAEHRVFVWGNAVHQRLHQWRQARKTGLNSRPAMRPLEADRPA